MGDLAVADNYTRGQAASTARPAYRALPGPCTEDILLALSCYERDVELLSHMVDAVGSSARVSDDGLLRSTSMVARGRVSQRSSVSSAVDGIGWL